VSLITLTTDFGARDWFVGVMKGVVLGLHPRATIVDLTHDLPPGDVRAGAFALMAASQYFPNGTVHVAVVDPGVGGPRRALAVQTERFVFLGPDNGVLSWALRRERIRTIRVLENAKYFRSPLSSTFHGRDLFAPAAAHVSRGLPPARLGRAVRDFVSLPWPQPVTSPGEVRGQVIYLDRFGNAITNLPAELLAGAPRAHCQVTGRRTARAPLAAFYGAVPVNRPVAVVGSSGFLEMAVNGGSAARRFGLQVGDLVRVRLGA